MSGPNLLEKLNYFGGGYPNSNRTPIKIIPDRSVSVTLVSFFQKENVNKGLLTFKTYFFKTCVTPRKLLQAKAFNARLEASLS